MRPDLYKRTAKPMFLTVKERKDFQEIKAGAISAPLTVDKATECHVTPSDVAARMVRYLGPQGDYLTLEPSAGTGQLVRALFEAGHSRHEITMVERHIEMARRLRELGPVFNECFLEYAARVRGAAQFPRIIMNPPFSKVKAHIEAALSLLGRGGHDRATLVALVPVTFDHPEAEHMETLPADTFAHARVNTKIIRIVR